jgi:hypothetical protein
MNVIMVARTYTNTSSSSSSNEASFATFKNLVFLNDLSDTTLMTMLIEYPR